MIDGHLRKGMTGHAQAQKPKSGRPATVVDELVVKLLIWESWGWALANQGQD